MASGPVPVPIAATRTIHSAAGYSIPVIRLWVELAFARRTGGSLRRDCLLDTGAPLSVVPYLIHHLHDFAWQPLPGPWPTGFMTWFGVPCVIGRMEVWAHLPHAPFLVGPLTFVAKFAQATPSHVTGPLPILLGPNFLADHQAEVTLQCHTPPNAGFLHLP